MTDPRTGALAVSLALAAFALFVRDRRGPPPPAALDAEIPVGIELVVADGATVATHRFGRRVLAGRAPSADIRVGDPGVSRLHARIEVREDGVYVEDLGSRNGTLVNGAPIAGSRRLAPDDEIGIGSASIIFRGVGTWK